MEQQTARIGVITSVRAVQHFDIDVLSVSISHSLLDVRRRLQERLRYLKTFASFAVVRTDA